MNSDLSYGLETLYSGQFGNFLSRVSLKSHGWSWKTREHLFLVVSIFVHHFIPISECKLKLQSGNAQSGSNRRVVSRVTSILKGWPSKTIWPLFYIASSFVNSNWRHGATTTNVHAASLLKRVWEIWSPNIFYTVYAILDLREKIFIRQHITSQS